MWAGSEPNISVAFVAQALREMSQIVLPQEHNPLLRLHVVEQVIWERAMPNSPESRTFALNEILVRIIERKFADARAVFELPMPLPLMHLIDIERGVKQDIQQDNAELMAYSLLYHCFARVDWSIHLDRFSTWIGVIERTARRYQAFAIRRLTHALIAEERTVRRAERQRWLLSRLPPFPNRRLIGRDELLNASSSIIDAPSHVLITGIRGIGKTAFAHALVRLWIQADKVSDIVWISQPIHVEQVRAILAQQLIPEGVTAELRVLLEFAEKPVVIVIDGCEKLFQHEQDVLESLLVECANGLCIFISQSYSPLARIGHHIAMPPLSMDDSIALLCEYDTTRDVDDLFTEQAAVVVQEIGGIPEALIAAIRWLEIDTWQHVRAAITEKLYAHVYEQLSKGARLAWCALMLLPVDVNIPSGGYDVWEQLLHDEALSQLRQWSVIARGTTATLETGARRYIESHAKQHGDIKSNVAALLDDLDWRLNRSAHTVIPIIEQLLVSDWVDISPKRRQSWIGYGAGEKVSQRDPALWVVILESIPESARTIELMILQGICLRRLGEWNRAETIFQLAISQTGLRADFRTQTRAIIEHSVILRYRGHFEVAQEALEQAERGAIRYAPELMSRIASEKARIALDRGMPDYALHLLSKQPDTVAVMLLKCEAYVAFSMFVEARTLAQALLVREDLDPAQQSAIHTLMGRSFEIEQNYPAAYWHFSNSAALAEWSGDVLAQARARGNIGAVLLHLKQVEKAYTTLQIAERELARLGDRVGIAAVRHNLQLVDMRLAR